MRAVRAVRGAFPNKLILADMKAPDVGGLEAKLAFDAGADYMTVMGSAEPACEIDRAIVSSNERLAGHIRKSRSALP